MKKHGREGEKHQLRKVVKTTEGSDIFAKSCRKARPAEIAQASVLIVSLRDQGCTQRRGERKPEEVGWGGGVDVPRKEELGGHGTEDTNSLRQKLLIIKVRRLGNDRKGFELRQNASNGRAPGRHRARATYACCRTPLSTPCHVSKTHPENRRAKTTPRKKNRGT